SATTTRSRRPPSTGSSRSALPTLQCGARASPAVASAARWGWRRPRQTPPQPHVASSRPTCGIPALPPRSCCRPPRHPSLQHHGISETGLAAELRWLHEALVEPATNGFDHPHGRYVVRIGRDFDEREADRPRLLEHRAQRGGGVATAALPGHDGVTDVAE